MREPRNNIVNGVSDHRRAMAVTTAACPDNQCTMMTTSARRRQGLAKRLPPLVARPCRNSFVHIDCKLNNLLRNLNRAVRTVIIHRCGCRPFQAIPPRLAADLLRIIGGEQDAMCYSASWNSYHNAPPVASYLCLSLQCHLGRVSRCPVERSSHRLPETRLGAPLGQPRAAVPTLAAFN